MPMKTEKLYWKDSYLKEFSSNIVAVEPYEQDPSKFAILMEETAFYPEGGGQPWDLGFIGEEPVQYVYEKEELIYHVVDKAPEQTQAVPCKINWERRFDFMQQHLGQHILSSIFEKHLNAATIGFHLTTETLTIDIELSSIEEVQLEKIQLDANQIIYDNIPVLTYFPTQENLTALSLTKTPIMKSNVRIVEIEQLGFSACSGTHPSQTGDVGIIKIRKWEKIKGNIRIDFSCGNRALNEFLWKHRLLQNISSLLSIREEEVPEYVFKLVNENKSISKRMHCLKKRVLNYQVKELYAQAKKIGPYSIIRRLFEEEDFNDIRFIASSLSQYPDTIVLLALKTDKAQVIFSCAQNVSIPMNKLFSEVASLINGKGGGNETTAQGGGDDLANLEMLLDAACLKIEHEYAK
jgi:alanyl-tRNA synthetase